MVDCVGPSLKAMIRTLGESSDFEQGHKLICHTFFCSFDLRYFLKGHSNYCIESAL